MSSSADSLPVQIQPRDIAVLRGLFESRIMMLSHVAALYFDGKDEAAKKRIQKLKTAGWVRERSRRLYEPSVLYLTRKAFSLLFDGGHIADYPHLTWEKLEGRLQVSDLTLRHELSVMDVKTAFYTAIRSRPTLTLAEFSTWPRLSEFNAFHPATHAKIVVKPDGFIRIHEKEANGGKSEHLFFLEVDRSTETLNTIVNRIVCYLNYYKRGGLAEKFGRTAGEYRDFPFRVLIVCKSEERKSNIINCLRKTNPPILTFAWLATIAESINSSLGNIWGTAQNPHNLPLLVLES